MGEQALSGWNPAGAPTSGPGPIGAARWPRRAVALSAISLWELAKMFERGRLEIPAPLELWLEEVETHPLIKILPLTARIVAESIRLGRDFHNDPADQMIVATARCHGLRLVTADERIRRWGKVPLV
ncbi:MAG: type II toxin-antitoxin system VapC family toxin [Acidobacteriota bacterium]